MARHLWLFLLLVNIWARAQSPDSIRTEISEERASIDSTNAISQERAVAEKKNLQLLLLRSREETTLIEIGMEYPLSSTGGGIVLFTDSRPNIEKTSTVSLWAGIEHKIKPAWSLLGGAGWQFSPSSSYVKVVGSSWLAQIGVSYYPVINKAIREGRSANNFYQQIYLTARALLPFHDQLTIKDSPTNQTITVNAFRQAAMLGIGIHSSRTKILFYNIVFGVAYLWGRDEGLQHPIQLMNRLSFGFGF